MMRRHGIWAPRVLAFSLNVCALSVLAMNLFAPNLALGQDTSTPQSGGTTPDSGQQPAPTPAYGPDNAVAPVSENPPISGLDLPGLEPKGAPLSYLQPSAHISQALDSNAGNAIGGSGVHTVTRALGGLELQRLWSNYDLALDYLGGVGYYNISGIGLKQLQQLAVDQRIAWKRGQLGIRDSFSYLPEGNFAGSYGSSNTQGQALGGFSGSGFYGGSSYGTLGDVPRIMNLSTADFVQNLTPKSSITATGGYSFVHYTGNATAQNGLGLVPFLGSTELSAQVGYDRILGPHDQMALTYGYQGFNFSFPSQAAGQSILNGTSFHTHVIQAMWGHRISGRMDFLIGAGPQITALTLEEPSLIQGPGCVPQSQVFVCPIKDLRLSVAGRASLRYRFTRATLSLTFERYTTSGSGLFPGANSNIAHLNASRPLSRVWSVFGDVGYSRNSRTQDLTQQEISLCAVTQTCPTTTANTYSYGFAGAGVNRKVGHDFRLYASYNFNYLTFDSSFCSTGAPCSRISQRHIGTIGLDWTPRPIRID